MEITHDPKSATMVKKAFSSYLARLKTLQNDSHDECTWQIVKSYIDPLIANLEEASKAFSQRVEVGFGSSLHRKEERHALDYYLHELEEARAALIKSLYGHNPEITILDEEITVVKNILTEYFGQE